MLDNDADTTFGDAEFSCNVMHLLAFHNDFVSNAKLLGDSEWRGSLGSFSESRRPSISEASWVNRILGNFQTSFE